MNDRWTKTLRRAAFHLLRAGVETLKAVEVVVSELVPTGDDEPDERADGPTRIPVT